MTKLRRLCEEQGQSRGSITSLAPTCGTAPLSDTSSKASGA